MAALSNTPWSTGLSFGTSHQGSNSSCQQQPFTYLSSQSAMGSLHFTSGMFVSPSLFSHCAKCVSACADAACTYSWVFYVSLCIDAFMRVSEKQNSIYTDVYPHWHESLECATGFRGSAAGEPVKGCHSKPTDYEFTPPWPCCSVYTPVLTLTAPQRRLGSHFLIHDWHRPQSRLFCPCLIYEAVTICHGRHIKEILMESVQD